jgi:hypothetical protein
MAQRCAYSNPILAESSLRKETHITKMTTVVHDDGVLKRRFVAEIMSDIEGPPVRRG